VFQDVGVFYNWKITFGESITDTDDIFAHGSRMEFFYGLLSTGMLCEGDASKGGNQ